MCLVAHTDTRIFKWELITLNYFDKLDWVNQGLLTSSNY